MELTKILQEQLFKKKEQEPRSDFAILFSEKGALKFKRELASSHVCGMYQRYFQGNSEFCGCKVFENEEIEQDFLIIKQV